MLVAIAEAVAHAHSNGVVHRDLKPANILVERTGRVVVTDFGLARERESSGLTISGVMVGTPRYMSPEQAAGYPATSRSDIYSLGLVYYYLLTSDQLVLDGNIATMVAQHLEGEPQARLMAAELIPDEDRRVISWMIDPDPERRPESLEQVVELLRGGLPPELTTQKSLEEAMARGDTLYVRSVLVSPGVAGRPDAQAMADARSWLSRVDPRAWEEALRLELSAAKLSGDRARVSQVVAELSQIAPAGPDDRQVQRALTWLQEHER